MSETEVPSSSTSSSLVGPHPSSSNIVQQLNDLTTMAVAAAVATAIPSSSTTGSGNPSLAVVEDLVGGVIKMDTTESVDDNEPLKKKLRIEDEQAGEPIAEKLENRLFSVLSCAVCLDLPKGIVYQCQNGHLMCAGCFTHLLADCRLRDETSTCPNCRVEIGKVLVSRNLAVEKAISELPDICQFCSKEFPRHSLERHEKELCIERTMTCKFARIGCPFRGPFHELKSHESTCSHPQKTGAEVMEVLRVQDQQIEEEKKLNNIIFDLLSHEKITFNDLQLKPYRTDEFVHKLYYETSRFTAFGSQFVVKARISTQQRDPTQSCERHIEYQLILKNKPTPATMDISFVVLKGPFGDMKLNPKIHRYEFSEQNNESTPFSLPLIDSAECNRVLASKTIHFRLIVFLQ